ncbi:hypothetical protein EUGRSUZ_F02180 [Eucalyptus grandis]|uniref:Uncharacterized protein n=2 Tax=Eucalyptus grandis TaxID=71139 RepID=A0ACC3KHF8_EUCGR|nr:hypothetical protein EUGRSUZ_F02180 [Eucalyptus grandis]
MTLINMSEKGPSWVLSSPIGEVGLAEEGRPPRLFSWKGTSSRITWRRCLRTCIKKTHCSQKRKISHSGHQTEFLLPPSKQST